VGEEDLPVEVEVAVGAAAGSTYRGKWYREKHCT
jgi:hypothetical protein